MSVTTGGAFPGGSYLQGAMPSEEQLQYAAQQAGDIPRDPAVLPHDVDLGIDGATFRPMWTCRHCGESQRDFMTSQDAGQSARTHAGEKGRVIT